VNSSRCFSIFCKPFGAEGRVPHTTPFAPPGWGVSSFCSSTSWLEPNLRKCSQTHEPTPPKVQQHLALLLTRFSSLWRICHSCVTNLRIVPLKMRTYSTASKRIGGSGTSWR
jgi:hypothetical protein